MGKGAKVDVGTVRVSQNGYTYVKCEMEDGTTKWRLKHHLIAEEKLGRPIREDERVSFINGKKGDFRPDNIQVVEKGTGSIRRRKAVIEARIEELQAELDEINKELLALRGVNRA